MVFKTTFGELKEGDIFGFFAYDTSFVKKIAPISRHGIVYTAATTGMPPSSEDAYSIAPNDKMGHGSGGIKFEVRDDEAVWAKGG